jgi:transcriptional regulator with XRE-family HTH domain
MIITPEQIRAARALLRMEQDELARRAQVSVVTIRDLEAADGLKRVPLATLEGVRHVLEGAGAEFIDRGVRRRNRTPEEIEARIRLIDEISLRSAARRQNLDERWTEDDLYDDNGLPA